MIFLKTIFTKKKRKEEKSMKQGSSIWSRLFYWFILMIYGGLVSNIIFTEWAQYSSEAPPWVFQNMVKRAFISVEQGIKGRPFCGGIGINALLCNE